MRLGIVVFIIFIASCHQYLPPQGNTEDWRFHLNTQQFFIDQVEQYGNKINNYKEVCRNIPNKLDSAFLEGNQVDWKFYLEPFVKDANVYDTMYAGKYEMIQSIDTSTNTVTFTYTPYYDNYTVQKMIVNMNAATQDVVSIYAELNKNKILKSEQQRILYVRGKTIQIITDKGGVDKDEVRQLYFLGIAPTIEIAGGRIE